MKENEAKKKEAKAKGIKVVCKRQPKQPLAGHSVPKTEPVELRPVKFQFLQ